MQWVGQWSRSGLLVELTLEVDLTAWALPAFFGWSRWSGNVVDDRAFIRVLCFVAEMGVVR